MLPSADNSASETRNPSSVGSTVSVRVCQPFAHQLNLHRPNLQFALIVNQFHLPRTVCIMTLCNVYTSDSLCILVFFLHLAHVNDCRIEATLRFFRRLHTKFYIRFGKRRSIRSFEYFVTFECTNSHTQITHVWKVGRTRKKKNLPSKPTSLNVRSRLVHCWDVWWYNLHISLCMFSSILRTRVRPIWARWRCSKSRCDWILCRQFGTSVLIIFHELWRMRHWAIGWPNQCLWQWTSNLHINHDSINSEMNCNLSLSLTPSDDCMRNCMQQSRQRAIVLCVCVLCVCLFVNGRTFQSERKSNWNNSPLRLSANAIGRQHSRTAPIIR